MIQRIIEFPINTIDCDTYVTLSKYMLSTKINKARPKKPAYKSLSISFVSDAYRSDVISWLMNTYKEPSIDTWYISQNEIIYTVDLYLNMSSSVYTMYTLKYGGNEAWSKLENYNILLGVF